MATIRIPILEFGAIPDVQGNIFVDTYDNYSTNDLYDGLVIAIADSAVKNVLHGRFNVPKNYVGTASIVIVWTAIVTVGNVVFDFDYTAVGGNDTESFDPAAHQESVTVTDAAPAAVNRRLEASVNLTSANLAADDTVQFQLSRDGTDAADTMAGTALILGAYFQYSDV